MVVRHRACAEPFLVVDQAVIELAPTALVRDTKLEIPATIMLQQAEEQQIQRPKDRQSTRPELQSLMRISYDVFCLKKKNNTHTQVTISNTPSTKSHTQI